MSSYNGAKKAQIDALVQQWLAVDQNNASRAEIAALHEKGDYKALDSKLSKRIAFGTAGLRASMEAGYAHMNDVTVLQATQGLVQYLLAAQPSEPASLVVGYDHRHHSQRFAEITASVALAKGLTVYYLGTTERLSEESGFSAEKEVDRLYVHTPMVPFTIDHFGASAGVMVTASHNPAQDNGFKVYYGNGCQIIPPHDDGIAESIDKNLDPWVNEGVWDVQGTFEKGLKKGLLKEVKREISEAYVEAIASKLILKPSLTFDFVYTPVHGVGLEIFERVFGRFNTGKAKMHVVAEQMVPDPDFPTVKFPNPEEKGALDLAIAQADKSGLELVIANDPDADRFSVAVKSKKTGKWQQLTGNAIGFLFAMYVVEELIPKESLSKTYLVNLTVSSQVLLAMAQKDGFHFQDTLTGFKWIGNKAIDLKKDGFLVPFGYEEAIGFMFDVVNDKDGISAAAVWLQLHEKWFANGQSDALQKLEEGYKAYGFFHERNGYYKLKDLSKTQEIFETVRKSFPGHQPDNIGSLKVVEWRDLTVGYESSTTNHVPILPTDLRLQMITAVLEESGDSVRFTCRGSGTEPKLKVYIEGSSAKSSSHAEAVARKCWDTLRTEWFRPAENGLTEVVQEYDN